MSSEIHDRRTAYGAVTMEIVSNGPSNFGFEPATFHKFVKWSRYQAELTGLPLLLANEIAS